jgi:hypothetical protein
MKVKVLQGFSVVFILLLILGFGKNEDVPLSEQTKECLECHRSVTPGIVADWEASLHSRTTPTLANLKPELQRRISSGNISGMYSGVAVGCYECHSLNAENHKDNFEHFGQRINVVVSPNDCATCHETEVKEYQHSKKGYALDILRKNPIYSLMVGTYTDIKMLDKNNKLQSRISERSKNQSCYACHGTEVTVSGMKKTETDLGEIEVPVLKNWPNMGVGRINPDGSRGACTSCHPRHNFSIEIARKPSTCGQCHLEPDVPAYNVYKESKHGTIYENFESKMNFSNVPWVAGKDFTAPTCAACHNSLITDGENNLIAQRTHDFGSRLWVRIFGLPFAHSQPKTPKTFEIINADKQPLPVTFSNIPAKDFLIDEKEIAVRKNIMGKVCKSCHGTSWVNSHFENLDSAVAITNQMTKTATELMTQAWEKELENPENPFDEPIEQEWVKSWLLYSNSIRYAAAMSGPDYAGFKNGWYDLSNCIHQMYYEVNKEK